MYRLLFFCKIYYIIIIKLVGVNGEIIYLLLLEVDDGPDGYAAGRFDFDGITAIAVAFACDGRHLDRVKGVRLQAGDVALQGVCDVKSQRFVEQRVVLVKVKQNGLDQK